MRSLRTASPLIITGLAALVVFRSGFIFLGLEGSLYFGAFIGVLAGIYVAPSVPLPLQCLLAMLAGAGGGALWALLPAWLKTRWRVDEIVSSLMLNYVAVLLVDHLVFSYFQDPAAGTSAERALTLPVAAGVRLPFIWERYGLTIAILIGVVMMIGAVWFYRSSRWAYEADMAGANRRFARYGGINVTRVGLVSMVASGAIAGLAGSTETLGNYGRFVGGFSSDLGFDGLTVALMGRLNPLGTLAAALFLGALKNGGASMELAVNVPRDLVVVLQGLIVLTVTAQGMLALFRGGWRRKGS
jgi:simple sugar transport system permease protein